MDSLKGRSLKHKPMENTEEYKDMVRRLAKPGADILGSMSTNQMIMLMHVSQLMIQAGTILDVVKRLTIYNKPVKEGDEDRLPKAQADIQQTLGQLARAIRVHDGQEEIQAFEILGSGAEEFFERNDAAAAHRMHMAIGLAGEGCELMEACYAEFFEGEILNEENYVEENGDAEFYLEGGRQSIPGMTRQTACEHNELKLDKGANARHKGDTYTDDAQADRADKDTDGED